MKALYDPHGNLNRVESIVDMIMARFEVVEISELYDFVANGLGHASRWKNDRHLTNKYVYASPNYLVVDGLVVSRASFKRIMHSALPGRSSHRASTPAQRSHYLFARR